jgi:hypothetical protein
MLQVALRHGSIVSVMQLCKLRAARQADSNATQQLMQAALQLAALSAFSIFVTSAQFDSHVLTWAEWG